MIEPRKLEWLNDLSCNGSVVASLYLKEAYSEGQGVEKDDEKVYKYTCYAALGGDLGSAIDLYNSGRDAVSGFAEDNKDPRRPPYLDQGTSVERTEDREDGLYIFYKSRLNEMLRMTQKGDNEGYVHPYELGSYTVYEKGRKDPAEIIAGIDPSLAEKYPPKKVFDHNEMEGRYSEKGVGGALEYLEGCDDALCWRELFRFYGMGLERDPAKALENLVAIAEKGNVLARDAVAYITGFHPKGYDARYPMRTKEEQKKLKESRKANVPYEWDFYQVADRSLIQDSIAWTLIRMLYDIDPYGICSDGAYSNRIGGREDEVLSTHPDNDLVSDPPTFVFKPSGLELDWYKYAWRSMESSENLSVGEVLGVFRLLVEHKALGKEIPKGTTKELLALPMYLAKVPDELKERVEEICGLSTTNLFGWACSSSLDTFHQSPDQEARRVIRGIEKDLNGEDRGI